MFSRRPLALATLATGVAMLAGCGAGTATSPGSGGPAGIAFVAPTPPDLTITPADRATGVPLDLPVKVSSSNGSLADVVVTRTDGTPTPVPGALSSDGRSWTASDGLDPSARYLVTATAVGSGGTHTTARASFATTAAAGRLLTDSTPPDGATVGVGEPIDLTFSVPIAQAQQQEIVKHLKVVSTPAQAGAWHWFSATQIHYRPEQYWQSGTKVTVTASFHGVNAGNGVWGLGDWSSSFTVGSKHVSVLSDVAHTMSVYQDDQKIGEWPISMGKPGFATLSGNLIVLYKTYKIKMNSCQTFGGAACVPGSTNYYDDYVYYDTAISTNGFFIHSAPWSVGDQGYRDVSHGCVNISPAHATFFYNWSLPGDVVQISSTVNVADINNGEADWQTPWAQWDNTGVAAPVIVPNGAQQGGE
ncbi:MAG TPA: Ig-like domain-containing protein [Candidatus Dormibacteraeota bacterium]|nr:Ig-like domain-containing protein [Candidatus Dormibacteraeota bacterium]